MGNTDSIGELTRGVLGDLRKRAPKEATRESTRRGRTKPPSVRADAVAGDARYDSDLAEFPAFRFGKRNLRSGPDRLHYTDQILGRDREPVVREWTTYRPRLGWGGASTHALLFDLFQLWKEQGFAGNRITFGTLRWLLRRRYPDREPAADDFQRIRRDLRILCGYTFDAKNAFWDPDQKCYRDMEEWSLFTGVAYARPTPDARQEELPFGFIEVSSTLHYIAQRRGFFVTGFDGPFFHGLRPHEQRLSLYLAKMFTSCASDPSRRTTPSVPRASMRSTHRSSASWWRR